MARGLRLSEAELRGIRAELRGIRDRNSTNKFSAVKTTVDGVQFDSKHEAERYHTLKILMQAGEISDLKIHQPLHVEINGEHAFTYYVDFKYKQLREVGQPWHYEDAKGCRRGAAYQLFRLKAKVVKIVMGIDVEEV